jgi:hypothetical protein
MAASQASKKQAKVQDTMAHWGNGVAYLCKRRSSGTLWGIIQFAGQD